MTTITEALAEIKTIQKRVQKKRESILPYLARVDAMKDPLAAGGGSVQFIQRELQSIKDLEERVVELRRLISKANTDTSLTVNGETRSIQDWLTWRREVAPERQGFVRGLLAHVNEVRQQAAQKGVGLVQAVAQVGDTKPNDVLVNISESELVAESDHLTEVLGALDGQLSLKNATTTI